jgi:hypothetical protein
MQDEIEPTLMAFDSYLVNKLQPPTSAHPHPQGNAAPLNADHRPLSNPNPLADITDEPAWMKKKRTLNYLRETVKLGFLPDIIRHWYEIERLLGFQEVVGFCKYFASCIVLIVSRPHRDFRYPHVHQ